MAEIAVKIPQPKEVKGAESNGVADNSAEIADSTTERAQKLAALKEAFFNDSKGTDSDSVSPNSQSQSQQDAKDKVKEEASPPQSTEDSSKKPPGATDVAEPASDSVSLPSKTPLLEDGTTCSPLTDDEPRANSVEVFEANNNADEPDVVFDTGSPPGSPAAGYDEPDKVSVFSYFMEKDFRYYFQHPYFRLLVVYLVTFCNFLIYAEDPVAHSEKECYIPVVGNVFAFVCTKYPPNAWSLLKVFLWLAAIVCGMIVGKLLVHKIFLKKLLRLKMFDGDQGSWMVMFFACILFVFIFSWIYNAFLLIGGDSTKDYAIDHMMGIKNNWFMKAAACGTWSGDFFTAWMVTDIMLQEKLYPGFAKPVRKWWNRGWNRIVLFWAVSVTASVVVVMVIGTDWINWDSLNRDFVASNEISRSFLASFILVMDLLIVMQDWDFPHFINNFDIKLPGLNTSHIKFEIPTFLKQKFMVHITGKWFNYGIIFIVMILDLNMWKNQMFYEPYDYGQYVDSRERIHTVQDEESLESGNTTMFDYDWRANNTNPLTNQTYLSGDTVMNSRFEGYALGLKCIAFVPSIGAAICFGLLIGYFGRWKPTRKDPHGGRLMKRRKKRRSWFMRQFSSSSRRKRSQVTSETTEPVAVETKDDMPCVIVEDKAGAVSGDINHLDSTDL